MVQFTMVNRTPYETTFISSCYLHIPMGFLEPRVNIISIFFIRIPSFFYPAVHI